jgi:inhibitor of KinA sporulation pathway (predicted exonuclease)
MSTPTKILVIDVEATCWENEPPNKTAAPRNEIIEIGITPIDIRTRTIEASRSIIVLPPTTEISEFCTKLTTLTPEFVEQNGIQYADAMKILKDEFKAHRNVFASWGDYDRRSFERNCTQNRVPYPFANLHLNVKALFAASLGYSGGLNVCAADMGLTFEGTHHRGVDDSRMIARILVKLLPSA